MSKVLKWHGLDMDPSKLNESTTIKLPANRHVTLHESNQQAFVLPKIEAIHAGRTRNFVHYTADKLRGDASLKSGVYSWVDPYAKPVIYNHDVYTDATGRVLRAAYSEFTQAGRPGIIVVPKITEANAIKAIQDGRLLTVSIGAHTDAAICSICGTDIANEGFCGHMKGEEYDGQVAEWITGNIWFEELSWVNVPADEDAMIVGSESQPDIAMTTEMTESDDTGDINAYYKVPKGIPVIEALSSESNDIDKGGEDMPDKADTIITEDEVTTPVEPETTEAPEATEPEATEPEVTKPEGDDEPTADETPEGDDTPAEPETTEAPEAPAEPETPAEPEAPADDVQESVELDKAKALNVTLQTEIESLTEELKTFYKQAILEKVDYEDEKKMQFSERLNARTLNGLKETLEDINSGFFMPVKKTEDKRKVEKVASPIKESKEEPKLAEKKTDLQSTLYSMFTGK